MSKSASKHRFRITSLRSTLEIYKKSQSDIIAYIAAQNEIIKEYEIWTMHLSERIHYLQEMLNKYPASKNPICFSEGTAPAPVYNFKDVPPLTITPDNLNPRYPDKIKL